MGLNFRRVVMGEPVPGKSEFTHVEDVQTHVNLPTVAAYDVWGWNELPTFPHGGRAPYPGMTPLPTAGGVRVQIITMAAEGIIDVDNPDVTSIDGLEATDGQGFHTTDTVDVAFVISGKVASVASDGTRTVLAPGDIYIQNGAPHAWLPLEPTVIGVVLIGTSREPSDASQAI